jgi:hypothetical protein
MTVATATGEAIAERLHLAPVTLTGPELRKIRVNHPKLGSPACQRSTGEPDHRGEPALQPLRMLIQPRSPIRQPTAWRNCRSGTKR